VENFEDRINDFTCNRLYCTDNSCIITGKVKSAGLGTIGGMADSYWGQNKGRSMEGNFK